MTEWSWVACLPTMDPYVKNKLLRLLIYVMLGLFSIITESFILEWLLLGSGDLAKIYNTFEQSDSKITTTIWEATQRVGVRRLLAWNIP